MSYVAQEMRTTRTLLHRELDERLVNVHSNHHCRTERLCNLNVNHAAVASYVQDHLPFQPFLWEQCQALVAIKAALLVVGEIVAVYRSAGELGGGVVVGGSCSSARWCCGSSGLVERGSAGGRWLEGGWASS